MDWWMNWWMKWWMMVDGLVDELVDEVVIMVDGLVDELVETWWKGNCSGQCGTDERMIDENNGWMWLMDVIVNGWDDGGIELDEMRLD